MRPVRDKSDRNLRLVKLGVEENVHAEVKMAKRENYLEKPGLTSRVDLGKHAYIQSCLHFY